MSKRTVSGITLTLLFIGMLALAFNMQPVRAEPTTIIVPDNYEKIQWAIGNASDGDTIFVRADIYYENLTVDKSISLIGEDKYNTIVDGRIDVSASNVNITGFTARLIGAGGSGNTIIDNLASAIGLWYGYDGGGNTVINNIVLNYMEYTFGINVYVSDRNKIINNKVLNFTYGIRMYHSKNNVIEDNEVLDNQHGIILEEGSCDNIIHHNNVESGYSGVYVRAQYNPSNNNTISRNNMTNNYIGFWLSESSNNRFYHNNFVDNTEQVHLYQSFNNIWDNGYPSGGNYWSDHVCTGNPSDGSQPYIMDEHNVDHYPFQDPNGWLLHQLAITSSPITGIAFTINGVPHTTPYTNRLPEGSYTLEMPKTHNGYVWSHWLEDADPNRTKTITLPGTTWTGVFVFAVQPHGPEAEFTAIPDAALTGESMKFDASASLPGWNGTHIIPITEYRWGSDDNNQTTTSTPIAYYSFSNSGIYYVTLTVHAPGATPDADSTTHKVTITAIPVGGYSFPIKPYTREKPLAFYLALVAILTTVSTAIKRKTHRRTKR